jgi:hypothetical protein
VERGAKSPDPPGAAGGSVAPGADGRFEENRMTRRVDELCSGWLNGSLGPEEEQELLSRLQADPELARMLARRVDSPGASEPEARARRRPDPILDLVRSGAVPRGENDAANGEALQNLPTLPGPGLSRPGTSLVGPALAGAAAVFAAVLIGGVAYVSHRQQISWKEQESEGSFAAGTVPAGPDFVLPGLRAFYFDRGVCEGPGTEHVESAIDFSLPRDGSRISPSAATGPVAVRWVGRFLAEGAGNFGFILSASGRVRFALDGQDLVSEARGTNHAFRQSLLRKKLAAGWHDLLLEYSEDRPEARCSLRYLPPGEDGPESNAQVAGPAGREIPARLFAHPGR